MNCGPPSISSAVAENPWLSQSVRIRYKVSEIPDVYTYGLEFTDQNVAAGYCFRPGQFNMLYVPGVGEVAISISAAPDSREVWDHTIRIAGNVTHALAKIPLGTTFGLRGPYGSSWPIDSSQGKDLILVAGGIGLAPLRPVIYDIVRNRSRFGNVQLLLGARTPSGLLYTQEYEAWKAAGIDIESTVDRAELDWDGNVGVVTILLDRLLIPKPENTVLMVCGPEVMMQFTIKSALKRGLSPERLWLSWERNMQCAVGLCGHCQWGPQFVCRDGPVFSYDEIKPLLHVEGL